MARLELSDMEIRVIGSLEDKEPQTYDSLRRDTGIGVGEGIAAALDELLEWNLVEVVDKRPMTYRRTERGKRVGTV